VIQLPVGTKVWIAAGVTDLRRGFDGLSAQVQNVLHEQPNNTGAWGEPGFSGLARHGGKVG
jgi:transposase